MIGLARMAEMFKTHGWRLTRIRRAGQAADERSKRESANETDAGGTGASQTGMGQTSADQTGTEQSGTGQPNDIVACIAADRQAGLTIPQIAARWRVPEDFVGMAIDRARERGLDVRAHDAPRPVCNATICRPDPASLLCAGCPFRATLQARLPRAKTR